VGRGTIVAENSDLADCEMKKVIRHVILAQAMNNGRLTLCGLGVLGDSVVLVLCDFAHHRATEDTKVAQSKALFWGR